MSIDMTKALIANIAAIEGKGLKKFVIPLNQ